MRLTVYTDYALRVLMYVAVRPEPLPTIGQIADAYQISRNHLMKVVYELGQAGYLETVRGKNGGLRLARKPQEIGLGRLVRETEPDMALVPCFDPIRAQCAITPACRLRGALAEARAAFLAVLDGYTLADLVGNGASLQALLGLAPAEP
ncbi:Rrf2 family transcriptional regulator [Phenylobacterium sp.]|mgnify:CR=1 FL=1|jgi:Rrf2 family nitric oxide-sensitive transcriptional repressor|uniref:Rrf2 family transcriptional regulator n=1 Tax=Phenylobacterium sp. TaxID=1871053 RepID=UPI00086CB73C|nr:MAG: Rrf2 family transcriptional regulator [Phenylobacterium sp. SCN 69-14]